MVVSFKISRVGTRYRPRTRPEPEQVSVPELNQEEVDEPAQLPKIQSPTAQKRSVDVMEDDHNVNENSDAEVSFILNIFPDGYTIVNPSESNDGHQNAVQDDPQVLRPYDRRSESMITAIECGYLPVDFLDDDIHCKYINGTVQCEVRDYRKESSESEVNDSTTADFPSITKLSLKISLDNVVKDINLIADSTWSYADLLEAESRILYALQPKLYLDPKPNLDRLCREPTYIKLNLDIRGKRLKRLRQASAPQTSNVSDRDSSQVTGQPGLVNLVDQNVGPNNMVATGPNNDAPESSNSNVRASRHVTGQPNITNLVGQNVGPSNMVATMPNNHAPESSNSRVRDVRQVTGHPDLVNLVNQHAGQSNMVATGPNNHAPESSNSNVSASRNVTGQPNFINLVGQNIGPSNTVATRPENDAPESSNLRVRDVRQVTSHPDFVNLANQHVGQSNMIATGPKNHAPENSNMRVGDMSWIMGQPDLVNLIDQDVGPSNMVAPRPNNHAQENSYSNISASRHTTGQPDLINLVGQNVAQSNMVATWLKNDAPESSNSRVGDSRQVTGHTDFINLVGQNVSQSNMVASGPNNHAPLYSNSSVRALRRVADQPEFINPFDQNVDQSNMVATRPNNHAPLYSNSSVRALRRVAGDQSNMVATGLTNDAPKSSISRITVSRQVTGQPDLVNLVNQNVGQSNTVATRPENHAPENSNTRVGDFRWIMGQPDLVNLVGQDVGPCNMVAPGPNNHAPESSNSNVRASRDVTGQPDFVNLVGQNVGQINMVATWPNNDAPESSNSRVRDSGQVTNQPDLVNLVNQNVGPSNMVATAPNNHEPEYSNVRASRHATSQPDFINPVNQNVGPNNMVGTAPNNHAPGYSNVRASRHATSQPDFINPVNQNVGPNNMVDTAPNNHAPGYSNVRASRHATSQPDFINPVNRNVGPNNMVGTIPNNHAPEYSNVRASRHATSQPDYINLVNQNVGPSNMVATVPNNHAPEYSNSRVRDSRQVTCQPDLVNPVNQNVGQSSMVAIGHAPENSNVRVGDLRWLTGQPDSVNLIDQNVSQSNTIARPINRTPDTVISSVSHQSSHQIGVGNLLNMQDHANDINSSSVTSSINNKRGYHFQELPTVHSNKRGRTTHVGLDGNQHMDNIQSVPQQFTRSNFHKAPWNNMSPNLESNATGSGGLQLGAGATSVPVVGEARPLTISGNESMQQAQMAANWISNTPQKAPVIVALGSSTNVGNINGPFTASYPVDKSMLDRFSKIQMLTARSRLNCKKTKIDEFIPTFFSTQQLKQLLISDHDDEDILQDETCKMPLSMSVVGGSMNICKTRVLTFVQHERPMAENGYQEIPKFYTRLILSERPSDGTVAMYLGDLEDVDYLADDLLLPTLPTTHMADLLAAQFCVLRLREGYHPIGDHLTPRPTSMIKSTGGQPNTTVDFDGWIQQFLDSESIYELSEQSSGETSQQSMHHQSIGLVPGLSTVRMHPHTVNNNRESQLQDLFLQQQEQPQIQRKMMMGPDRMGHWIGGNNNSMVQLGMGGDGHAGTRAVSPMMSHSPMLGELVGQAGHFGRSQGVNRQIHLGSGSGSESSGFPMLGSGVNRANEMSPGQRNVIERLNHMNLRQFQLTKQEPTSHLQAVVLPSQHAGSPSPSTGRPHQQGGPRQPIP